MSDQFPPETLARLGARLEARKRFFAQPVPPGYTEEWAEILAQPAPSTPERQSSMLEFRIGQSLFALESRYVKAVTDSLTICPVPHRNDTAFLGLVAFAGDIIPCISLARILNASDAITAADARTIILEERPAERWAFRVHAILGVSTGTIHPRTASPEQPTTTHPDPTWSHSLFEDEHHRFIDILRPQTLFQRLQRATA